MTQSPTSESLKLAGDARVYSYKTAPKECIIKRELVVERELNWQVGGFFSSISYAFYPEWTHSFLF